jgi:hypothetical protein
MVRTGSFGLVWQYRVKYAFESAVRKQMILDCMVSNTASG